MTRFLLQAAGGLTLSSVTGGDAKAAGQSQGDGSHPGAGDTRRHQRGRAEHRRHTITNGVDFSVVRGQPRRGLGEGARGCWEKVACRGSLSADSSAVPWLPPARVSWGMSGSAQCSGSKALLMLWGSCSPFRGALCPQSRWAGRRHVFPCLLPERGHPTEAAFDCPGAPHSVSLHWGQKLGQRKANL